MSTPNASAAFAALLAVVLLALLLWQLRARRAERRERTARDAAMDGLRRAYDDLERAHGQAQQYNVRLTQELDDAAEELRRSRSEGGEVLANLALRSLALVERQLGRLEGLEEMESDSLRLEQLYQLDHLATRMRRNSENMLLLAGGDQQRPTRPGAPASLLDVLRAALSEIERYERVHLTAIPAVFLRPETADDLSHVFAELLDNGTAFSPPTEAVTVTAWHLDSGEVMISVADRGIGMTETMLRQANVALAESGDGHDVGHGSGRSLGLRVVTLLAHRLGLRVQLRVSAGGDGTTALVALPAGLLVAPPAPTPLDTPPAGIPVPAGAGAQRPSGPHRPGGPALAAVPGARRGPVGGGLSASAGLPKRVKGESGQLAHLTDPGPDRASDRRPKDAGATADELRRRLGGFQNGLRAAAAPREEDDKA
ncbi:signal transduction histidine kinase [Streptacidiphilus sp. MAP12-33]|uniref:sensor histidine kinase n=1 Tax=Streptacidiphilus sp. MAP12-33 TaxID=3156266 RepID=UPI0035183D68